MLQGMSDLIVTALIAAAMYVIVERWKRGRSEREARAAMKRHLIREERRREQEAA